MPPASRMTSSCPVIRARMRTWRLPRASSAIAKYADGAGINKDLIIPRNADGTLGSRRPASWTTRMPLDSSCTPGHARREQVPADEFPPRNRSDRARRHGRRGTRISRSRCRWLLHGSIRTSACWRAMRSSMHSELPDRRTSPGTKDIRRNKEDQMYSEITCAFSTLAILLSGTAPARMRITRQSLGSRSARRARRRCARIARQSE